MIVGGGFAGMTLAQGARPGSAVGLQAARHQRRELHDLQPNAARSRWCVGLPGAGCRADPPDALVVGASSWDARRAIDPAAKSLVCDTLAGELRIAYDHLVLAFGNRARLDLIPGLAEHALPLKTVGDAMHIRNTVLRRVARLELEDDPELRRRLGHFVIIGGGFSGVEVAGELVDCLKSIRRYYPRVAEGDLKVTVLQDQPRLLPELSERLGAAAQRSLVARGGRRTARAPKQWSWMTEL